MEDGAYKHPDYGGVAFRVDGPVMIRDEDYEWSGIEIEDPDKVRAHMIGDDREFTFERDELTLINDDEFCPGCGQIGCTVYQ